MSTFTLEIYQAASPIDTKLRYSLFFPIKDSHSPSYCQYGNKPATLSEFDVDQWGQGAAIVLLVTPIRY